MAGGDSRRMGRDKALLPWDSTTTLLDHTLARLDGCCDEVRILSGPTPRYTDRGRPVDPDLAPDRGPLGGVLTGLSVLQGELGLFLAVDLPGANEALLERLLELAAGHDAVVPISSRGPEPLCAVYRGSCLPAVRRCLEAGQLKMTSFWPQVRVRRLEGEALRAIGPPEQLFRNLNTPEDYALGG